MSSSIPVPNIQEPPFPQPFIDKSGLITPVWQLYLLSIFQTQNQQNSGISENAAQIPITVGEETTRAEAAEAALGSDISAETTRAEAAEAANAADIATETARATAAEALLAPKANPTFTGVAHAPTFDVTGATAGAATAGAATLPSNPVGFLVFDQSGTPVKVPYYAI